MVIHQIKNVRCKKIRMFLFRWYNCFLRDRRSSYFSLLTDTNNKKDIEKMYKDKRKIFHLSFHILSSLFFFSSPAHAFHFSKYLIELLRKVKGSWIRWKKQREDVDMWWKIFSCAVFTYPFKKDTIYSFNQIK